MEFLNQQVDVDLLPKAESVELKPIERDYLTVIRFEWMISTGILLLICCTLIFFLSSLQKPVWIFVILTGWLLFTGSYFFLQTKSFYLKAYAIREKDIIYRSGWIIQNFRTCPFNRIQHSSVSISLFERKYGLATLSLFTAGSEGADLRIPGLKEEQAYKIKEWITQKISNEPLYQQ